MKNFIKDKSGITFLEILIVLAILGALIVVVFPSFNTMRNSQILKTTASDVFSALDKARTQSLSSMESSEYGVHFETDKIIVFKGTVFSDSDIENEEISIYSPAVISNINLSGGGVDLYFDRLSGVPNKTGTITILLGSLTKIVTISSTGAVSMN